jgi:uncharacterized membrane protein
MPKKFDTNPLDPEFPEKAKAAAAAQTADQGGVYTAPQRTPYSTSEFPARPGSVTEEETRRLNQAEFDVHAYQAAPPPAVYQPAGLSDMNRASGRKVAKTGLPEKWLIGLPYMPFWIGLVAGLILLLVIPKEENKVRFHAAQGFAAWVAISIVTVILRVVGEVTSSGFGGSLFWAATTVTMIVFAIKAWKGKPVHIEIIDDLTNWFEDKIGPIKNS